MKEIHWYVLLAVIFVVLLVVGVAWDCMPMVITCSLGVGLNLGCALGVERFGEGRSL